MEDFIKAIVGGQDFTAFLLSTTSTIVVAIVGWVAFQTRKFIAAHTTATELRALNDIAAVAVTYVEQKFNELDGPAKFARAKQLADSLIAAKGLKVTTEQLQAIIESAVFTEIDNAPGTDPVEPAAPAYVEPPKRIE